MKYLKTLLALLILFSISSCGPDDENPDGTPSSCEVTFMPLLADEDAMTISQAFTNDASLYNYFQHPNTFRSLIVFIYSLAIPALDSDCNLDGNTQTWITDAGGLYNFVEIEYLENQTNLTNIVQYDTSNDQEINFWEMNDHSSGYLSSTDYISGESSEINWTNINNDIEITLEGSLNGILQDVTTVAYNNDGSGSYQLTEDGNTETISWNIDGSGSYTNQNNSSQNETW